MASRVKSILISAYMGLKEKTFCSNGTRLKYMFFKGSTDALIISFSAFSKERAVYNYVRTLKDFSCSRLYIKDDFGPLHTGSYYLGEKGLHNVEPAVIELIKSIYSRMNSDCLMLFVGSSKGGYAALNFAIEFKNSIAIVGAPQYHLGTHLNEPYFYPMLEDIFGPRTDEKIALLDQHICDKYKKNGYGMNQQIYIQYSPAEWSTVFNEYTYERHIRYLLDDLEKYTNITVRKEVLDYKDHSDVHRFFPDYLKRNIKELLDVHSKLD